LKQTHEVVPTQNDNDPFSLHWLTGLLSWDPHKAFPHDSDTSTAGLTARFPKRRLHVQYGAGFSLQDPAVREERFNVTFIVGPTFSETTSREPDTLQGIDDP
jgi:hypothetical protein